MDRTGAGIDRIPVFKLYGETRQWPTPDLLHCESIAARSRLHDWHIRTHRHADLVHVLYIQAGQVALELEGLEHRLEGPLLIVIPAMTIHGFRFSEDIDGHIITLARPLAEHLANWPGAAAPVLIRPGYYPLPAGRQARRIQRLVEEIAEEYHDPGIGRDMALHGLIQALVSQLMRRRHIDDTARAESHPRRGAARPDRSGEHVRQFQSLIEQHFLDQPTIDWFAAALGITAAHLNALCRRETGASALQLLHERVLLEAKRNLTYTNLTISQVSDMLGFSEPAYFTRFFKRLTGLTPKAFRLRHSGSQEGRPTDLENPEPGEAGR
ncbi:helix-turn-helix domain-containing protein [Marinobacter halodurans]|uniref:helix-turn-helix domain-containing protein n=1 Tax=Marinobacter halodurans TaxID=2528979 RepID=UPI001A955E2E|nr:helix-turn-helix domain-containing protein [Marinobacter halodurans]